MPGTRRNMKMVARGEDDPVPVFVLEDSPSTKHGDPLMLRLIVPETGCGGLTGGDDTFYTHAAGSEKREDFFFRQTGVKIGKEIHVPSCFFFLNLAAL